jgi:hypothetical protein
MRVFHTKSKRLKASKGRVASLAAGLLLISCTQPYGGPTADLSFDREIEYVEVGRLIPASENVLVPLGPGRSYWFNGQDGSRWAADIATVNTSTQVVLIHRGSAVVDVAREPQVIRHVSGPRVVKRGWYGRVVEERATGERSGEVMLEDGRRFEVTSEGRLGRVPTPYQVVVSADTSKIFVLRSAESLAIDRRLPAS